MRPGRKICRNSQEPGPFTKEHSTLIISMLPCGWSTPTWRWSTNLLTTPGISGNGLVVWCPCRSISGTSMPTWRKWSEITKARGMFLSIGWNGSRVKRPGWATSSLKSGWTSPNALAWSCIDSLKLTPPCNPTWKSPSSKSSPGTSNSHAAYLKRQSKIWDNPH